MMKLFSKAETHEVYVRAYEIYRRERFAGDITGMCCCIQEALMELYRMRLTVKEVMNSFSEFRALKPKNTYTPAYWWSTRRGSSVRDQKFKLIIKETA